MKLWSLHLQSKGDANKHINDFTLYMDQLRELGREEREETLTGLFQDSILDPWYEVTLANFRLRDYISIHECLEAIRKHENIIVRENLSETSRLQSRRTGMTPNKTVDTNYNLSNTEGTPQVSKVDTGYWTYKERIKLTPEQ
jgi:hypothetical protein